MFTIGLIPPGNRDVWAIMGRMEQHVLAERSRHLPETRVVANVILDGRIGGPQRRIMLVGQRLHAAGWKTVLVFPPMGEELPKFLSAHRTRYVPLKLSRIRLHNPVINLLRYIYRMPREVRQLIALYRKEGVQLVHANSLFCLQVALSAKLAGCPLVWHFNDTSVPSWLCCLARGPIAWLATVRAYSGVRVRDHYGDRPGPRTTILYPPIDLDEFDPSRVTRHSTPTLPTIERRDGETLLIAVGNINPQKGYTYLIRALGVLKDLEPPWRLAIAGAALETNSEYHEELRQMVEDLGLSDRVVFVGAYERVAEGMAASDIVVISSIAEGGPIVLLEALAMGKSVVTTDVGIVNEVIRHEWNGLVVPPCDHVALADALRKMIVDGELRDRIARRARESVADEFTIDAVARKHARLYERVATGSPV